MSPTSEVIIIVDSCGFDTLDNEVNMALSSSNRAIDIFKKCNSCIVNEKQDYVIMTWNNVEWNTDYVDVYAIVNTLKRAFTSHEFRFDMVRIGTDHCDIFALSNVDYDHTKNFPQINVKSTVNIIGQIYNGERTLRL